MQLINFSLKKNNKFIINENNIKCINQENKIIFKINNDKYIYNNKMLTKETTNEIIKLDFNNNLCNIFLKEYNNNLVIKLELINIEKTNKFIEIKYKVETEIEDINIIRLEYI